jgi:hypothetical protein
MKRANALLIVLIALGNVTGCGAVRPALPVPPVILNLPDCPAPARPVLARIDGALPFDAPGNVAAFLERDDALRLHVQGLEATIACYRHSKAEPAKGEK